MRFSKARIFLVLLTLIVLLLLALFFYPTGAQNKKIKVEYTRTLPEEYTFDIKSGQYFQINDTTSKEDLKTTILKKLGLATEKIDEGKPFHTKLKINIDAPNKTSLGLEYSSMVFLDIRPIDNRKYPLLFAYKSPEGEEKIVKRYLLNNTDSEIELVGLTNEITITKNSPRSIIDSIRITLFNATAGTENPLEIMDYRIQVCGKWGC